MGLLGRSQPIVPPKGTPLLSPCLKGRGFTRRQDKTSLSPIGKMGHVGSERARTRAYSTPLHTSPYPYCHPRH